MVHTGKTIGAPRGETENHQFLLIQGANMEYLGGANPNSMARPRPRSWMPCCAARRARARRGLDILYTNTEGEAVSAIFKADRARIDGILFNPAGFLHAGHALRDCLRSIRAPAIEIHMTNIEKRGEDAAVHGGFVHVRDNNVILLSDKAELASQIDFDQALRGKENLERKGMDNDDVEVEANLRRVHVRLSLQGGYSGLTPQGERR